MPVIVLPALNEAASIRLLLDGLLAVPETRGRLRIIVVDDGSTDATAALVRGYADQNVELVQHERNRGLHEAMRTGLFRAVQSSGPDDVIITMDADNTHNPDLIPNMLHKIEEGYDVVIASRFAPGGTMIGASFPRHVYSAGARFILGARFRIPGVRDYTCGYRAYRASRIKEAFDRWEEEFIDIPGFTCMLDILLRLHALGARITEVPLVLRYDLKESASKLRVFRTIRSTLRMVFARLRT